MCPWRGYRIRGCQHRLAGTSAFLTVRGDMPENGYAGHCAVVPAEMTVLTTSKCDAKCAHCLMRSGPDRDDALRLREMVSAIKEAHEARPLRTVVFAGGEPTLLGDELLEAIAAVRRLGISTRLVTNAGWATSPDAARAVVGGLREAGLDELNFSADDFHLPFIPLPRVVAAWHAAKGAGFGAVVIALCSGPGSKVTPRTMMAALGEEVPLIYDDQGTMNDLPRPAADGTVYLISNNDVYRIGRGLGLREKYLRFADPRASTGAARSPCGAPRSRRKIISSPAAALRLRTMRCSILASSMRRRSPNWSPGPTATRLSWRSPSSARTT